MSEASWQALDALVEQRDPHCRGAVILGLNQPLATLAEGFRQATAPVVKGFMVGRSLWCEPGTAWLQNRIGDDTLIEQVVTNFAKLVQAWRSSRQRTSQPQPELA
jgi:5-dehydro-2-deoxygluconokinase